MTEIPETESAPPKKKGKGKLLMIAGALLLVGGGVGGGLYAMKGRGAADAAEPGPQLVPKSEQKRGGDTAEGGGHGGGEDAAKPSGGMATPAGKGGERYASNYYALEKEFTANLQDSMHFIQVGLAVSTPYDDTVVEHLKTNDLAVRSAVLLALGDTTEEQVFSSAGKKRLQARLVTAINETLQQKEGFGGVSNVYFTNFVVQ